MLRLRLIAVTGLVLGLSACQSRGPRAQVLAEAFVGPMELPLRAELDPKAPISATLRHGEKVEIIQTRRRFIRVRTPEGEEGWTTARQLMTPQQVRRLEHLAEVARALPSMGKAKVFDDLNLHTEPNRQAPSFRRITSKEQVDVLAQRTVPRVPFEPQGDPLIPPKPKVERKQKPKAEPRVPRLPVPVPALPENWQELSKSKLPPPTPAELEAERKRLEAERKQEEERRKRNPVRLDDWVLVRTSDGKAGWALVGPLHMAIPDEVAQYSEGNRITSYFQLHTVEDDGRQIPEWIWTTASRPHLPYDFDSFRVFIWRKSKDRYETELIMTGIEGYFPVQIGKVEIDFNRKKITVPSFSILMRDPEDGKLYRHTYSHEGWRAQLLSKVPAELPPDPLAGMVNVTGGPREDDNPDEDARPWYQRLRERFKLTGLQR